MALADVANIVRYWSEADPADLMRMAVDPTKIPAPNVFRSQLEALIDPEPRTAKSFYMIWFVDGRPVGYSSLKNIIFGDRAEMHLHMWDPSIRGQGLGARLFCLSALDFFERFRLRQIICEPGRGNPMPNAMLRRVGFRLVGTRRGTSSDLSAVTDLNTYEIEREVAERFLSTRVASRETSKASSRGR